MRNSIQGPLLRSGHNSSFKALGETGYPVFKMAFQLREAIYRLDAGRDLARHLAIPQNDQGGDRTDWYSSFPGDVIPWSGANEVEQASARQQFSEFQIAIQALSDQLLNASQSGTGGDRQVFAQLLKSVVHFPDYDFVYLVNGVLVITFWGFIHSGGEQRNPMHWLDPSSVPLQTPSTATAQSTPPPPVTQSRFRNWRWLLWVLLGLLLLALLLGLLRGCVPSLSLPNLPSLFGKASPTLSANLNGKGAGPDIAVQPDIHVPTLTSENSVVTSTSTTSQIDATQVSTHLLGDSGTIGRDSQQPVNNTEAKNAVNTNVAHTDVDKSTSPASSTSQGAQNSQQPQPATESSTTPPAPPIPGNPLTLPPSLPDGPAQFLNGQWRANGGIQDKLTGRPLQLQYQFEQGNGTVSVRQSNGVTCNGQAKGNVQQGTLSITNPKQMECSDGSNFIVPTIACKSLVSGHADCFGSNDGEKTFPIRMLQPNT